MNKHYFMWLFVLAFGVAQAQVLNEPANWPSTAWTVTGNYATSATAFEASPLTTANFAFDDDDAGASHEDNIAAESPVIDLTPAHAAGEIFIAAQTMYVYRRVTNDRLNFEYWDADTATWILWETVPPNSTTINDNYCDGTKTLYKTPFLNIANFTPTQLAGFRYRIAFDDNPAGTGYVWGFCVDSPLLTSTSCASPFGFTVTQNSGNFTVAFEGGSAFEYVMSNEAATPAGAGTPIAQASFTVSGLTAGSTVYFHVRAVCGDEFSDWATYTYIVAPVNDECWDATPLTVNADMGCAVTTPGTLVAATASPVPDNGAGAPDDDVWFSFVAVETSHSVTISGVTGTPTDLAHEVMSGSCGQLVSMYIRDPNESFASGLIPGETYYVRVFSYGANTTNTTNFNICIGTAPSGPANDECDNAIALTVNQGTACTVTTPGSLAWATSSMVPANGVGNADDDVWFSFVATAATHNIALSQVTGSTTDLVHEVMSGSCGSLTSISVSDPNVSIVSGLTIGETYYVRVYTSAGGTVNTTTFNICVATPPPPPVNDECETATALTVNPTLECAVTATGTLVSATASPVANAGVGTPDDDVWFSFVATQPVHFINITGVTGTPSDIVHEIMGGECGSLVSLLVTDTPNSSTATGLTPGETYYIRVFTYTSGSTNTTTFTICVATPPAPPANDECSGAISLTVNADYGCAVKTPGTTASATASPVSDNGSGTPNNDVWFSFVATTTSHRVSLSEVTGTTTDMMIEIMSGDCGTLASHSLVNSNNNLATGLTIGNTYYVRIFSWGSSASTTNFNVCVGTPPPPPANDLCEGAISVAVDANFCSGSNTNGTNESATPTTDAIETCYTTATQNDVWFTFTVPMNTTSVNVSTDFTGGTMMDSRLEVYSGSCGSLVAMDCDDDSGDVIMPNGFSWMSFIGDLEVTPGETYYVRVFGVNSSSGLGSFCLEITSEDVLSTVGFEQSAFKAYPNPVTDVLNFGTSRTISEVTVYSLIGQQVMTHKASSVSSIDLSGLSAGTYFVKVTDGEVTETVKILKK